MMATDEPLELEELEPSVEKRTRFQVNRVRTESTNDHYGRSTDPDQENDSEDDDIATSDTTRLNVDYHSKSLRRLTREALPRIDNYRNVTSIQATNRPTLEELHSATLGKEVASKNEQTGSIITTERQIKFGWIQGVLVRCLLNIWGVMLFLRLSWVVAQTGIGLAILLILTTTIVTSITALSMSAISTNGVIKGGGTYYMISRSLGPEFGGSIGLIFSLANAVACAMYVVGFCESLQDLIRRPIVDGGINDVRIIGCITLVVLTGIVVFGMEWEAKAQLVLLVILLVAIFDFLIGCFMGPRNDEKRAKGFVGFNETVIWTNMFPDYRDHENISYDFFKVFAVFFPAATGILAGANISGDLKDPQKAIPKGTLLAIFITTMSYIVIAILVGCTVLRDATGNVDDYLNGNLPNPKSDNLSYIYGLHNSFQVIELVSGEGSLIYAGCFAATLSSALASLVSAPKVFQALCKDKLYPFIEFFGKGFGANNEPIRGYILTFVIAIGFILIGELNMIAPLISNFFLAAYTLINFSTFHASLAKPVGWRPTFKYYNMWLSLLGAVLCVVVMFLISWWTALITLAVILALYLIVSYRKPNVNWGSTTQAQIYKNALQAVHQLESVEEHVKNYRPQILVLVGLPSSRPALVNFAHIITKNLSLMICGHVITEHLSQRTRNILNYKASEWIKAHKLKAFYQEVDGVSLQEGAKSLMGVSGIGKLKPNILLIGYKTDWQTCPGIELINYFEVLHEAFGIHLGLGILRLPDGLDVDKSLNDSDTVSSKMPGFTLRTQSYSQLSQGSSGSEQSLANIEDKVSVAPNMEDGKIGSRGKHSVTESAADLASEGQSDHVLGNLFFQRRPKRTGTIDVWWLYDDGGLTLLLPYIITTRRNFINCKLRVFALANKREELEMEHRNMASMLAKFRIEYSDLQIVPDIISPPSEGTQSFFTNLIANFRQNSEDTLYISDAELMAVKDKTNRHMRLRELLLSHSHEATMVVITLPIPRKSIVSAPLYLAWLELLTRDMPPTLLVRGNQTSVLTFYS
ncbi:bumetanide-sensitive sodium-(potassium)-chloride cotransporter [Cylas formicarius]|uniref:bumetanide-sensitive sodium-(potassium)-chloride cotransporter n=1 Tax=Cylas formicarius TaxID=197179 RepID=UPI002958555D|nr:bumetanide-sensitive sodium-(potassium)-chloride cotransporter [Cylas formicarius]XP_060523844.1 bumetanide-sensitive sodium-(potassium)-chloride cotransporter [Cylas formicarius]